jgi:hypothetical protein
MVIFSLMAITGGKRTWRKKLNTALPAGKARNID